MEKALLIQSSNTPFQERITDSPYSPGGLRGEFTPPTESWTSGFRCFWLIRLFLNRVTEMYCTSRRHNGEIFWADAPGYFDPDIVRQEMFGYTTAVIHRMTEYNTRAAIEPILKVNLNGVAIEAKELKPKSMCHQEFPCPQTSNGFGSEGILRVLKHPTYKSNC